MRSAVVIGFDNQHVNRDVSVLLQRNVTRLMVEAGFRYEERFFTINLPVKQASAKARSVIDSINPNQDDLNKTVFRYISEFYCFQMKSVVNLLIPGESGIEVKDELCDARHLLSTREIDALLHWPKCSG